jgi:hypothetical protein
MSHDAGDVGYGAEVGHDHGGYGDNDTARVHRDARVRTGVHADDKMIDLHVESHGAIDVKKLFIELARKINLVPIDMYRPNLMAEDRVQQQLVDWDAWSPPDDEKIMPSGQYPGASGWTRLWKEFWQIGQRSSSWRFWEPLEPRFDQRTWLEVSCVTWCYNEAGDFQTHLTIEIKFLPIWDPKQRVWMYDGGHFDNHKAVAEKLARKLCEVLTGTPPFPHAKIVRQRARDASPPPPVVPIPPEHPPIPPAPDPGRRPQGDTATAGTQSNVVAAAARPAEGESAAYNAQVPASGADLFNVFGSADGLPTRPAVNQDVDAGDEQEAIEPEAGSHPKQ